MDSITFPHALIQQLSTSTALSSLPSAVSSHYTSFFQANPPALAALPNLTALSTSSNLPPRGSVVRFRAMVQDTGVGNEVYRAATSDGRALGWGIEEVESEHRDEDYGLLRERMSCFVVSVPGETDWMKKNLQAGESQNTNDLDSSVQALSLSDDTDTGMSDATTFVPTPIASAFANKFPIPSEPHFGLVAKFYGDSSEEIKICQVYDFVGVFGETPISSPFDDLLANANSAAPVASSISATTTPALHILCTLPASTPILPALSTDVGAVRSELIEFLARGTLGDRAAAEWVLLSLLGKIHTRHPSGISLGRLSLNLSYPTTDVTPTPSTSTLFSLLPHLLPTFQHLPLSILHLNSKDTKMNPRNLRGDEECLEAGLLQMADDSWVGVDLRGVGEGMLDDTGVRNLRNLTDSIKSQKLNYEFPYSAFELEMDLGFLVISEGRGLIPTDGVVLIQPNLWNGISPSEGLALPLPSESKLNEWRSYLLTMSKSEFVVPPEMSEIVQSDFVNRRQKTIGGKEEAMSQEDLLFRMTVARLMTLSHGKTSMDAENWQRTAELDEERKLRLSTLGIPSVAGAINGN